MANRKQEQVWLADHVGRTVIREIPAPGGFERPQELPELQGLK